MLLNRVPTEAMSTLYGLTELQTYNRILTSPGFTMLLGGLLTLVASLSTEWWRTKREKRNLSQSLRVEIQECSFALDHLKAAAEYDQSNEISWDSYNIEAQPILENSSGLDLKFYLVSRGMRNLGTNFDDVYRNNCEDIGKLGPEASKFVIQFYSEYRELQSRTESKMEQIQEYQDLAKEHSRREVRKELPDEKWGDFAIGLYEFNQLLTLGEDTYELQQKCLSQLE